MNRRITVRGRSGKQRRETPEMQISRDYVQQVSTRLMETRSLRDRRLQAWETYQSMPMPSRQDEPWRRTDIRGLPFHRINTRPVEEIPIPKDVLRMVKIRHGLMILQPGHATKMKRDQALSRNGILFEDYGQAIRNHPSLLETYLGTAVQKDEGKFAALASSMAEEGAIIYVPPGVEVQEPLHSILWAPGIDRALFSRLLVVVDKGAKLTYVHEVASPTEIDGQSVHIGTVELLVADNASLTFIELQNWGEHVWHFTHERAKVERDGRLDWVYGAVGGHRTKNFMTVDLLGVGAECRMSGLFFTGGRQHMDHDTQQNHWAASTTSDLLFKGGLLGRSHSVWQGMIYVAPGAQQADGYQANRNLLLSEKARADSIPGLEILADDVRCTHGATVGRLEQDPLFYIMARGIPKAEAKRIVVRGFFAPILDRIPLRGVRKRFGRMIDRKLG